MLAAVGYHCSRPCFSARYCWLDEKDEIDEIDENDENDEIEWSVFISMMLLRVVCI